MLGRTKCWGELGTASECCKAEVEVRELSCSTRESEGRRELRPFQLSGHFFNHHLGLCARPIVDSIAIAAALLTCNLLPFVVPVSSSDLQHLPPFFTLHVTPSLRPVHLPTHVVLALLRPDSARLKHTPYLTVVARSLDDRAVAFC